MDGWLHKCFFPNVASYRNQIGHHTHVICTHKALHRFRICRLFMTSCRRRGAWPSALNKEHKRRSSIFIAGTFFNILGQISSIKNTRFFHKNPEKFLSNFSYTDFKYIKCLYGKQFHPPPRLISYFDITIEVNPKENIFRMNTYIPVYISNGNNILEDHI